MLFIRFISLMFFIRKNWSQLSRTFQADLVEQLEDYKEFILISKLERKQK